MPDEQDYGDRTELAHEPPRDSKPRRPAEPVTPSSGQSGTPSVTPSDTWSDDPWDRTSHAREGAQLARLIEQRLARWQADGVTPRRVVVQEPEERTGGGARARLPIAIASDERKRGTVVVGWVDPAAGRIALKTYGWIEVQHRARFSQPWDVSGAAYERLTTELVSLARGHGLTVEVLEEPHTPLHESEAEVPRWVWVALGVLIGVGAAWLAVKL